MAQPASHPLKVRLQQAAPIPLAMELECAPGELLALVGPSGSGKSTVLRCIAGLYSPESGQVECGGRLWFDSAARRDLSPQERRVGFVFQNYSLFPHFTALENVCAALGHLPREAREAQGRALLRRVHLEGLDARRPAQLSGGQQQRVALARALARDPDVLLLDEPFSAVDQVTRRKLQNELARLRRELAIPIVLVTHDLDEARKLADRMTLLSHGRSLQSGTPEDLLQRPASTQVARLVELYNVFEGQLFLCPEDGRWKLRWFRHVLEVADPRGFQDGQAVSWLIAPAHVVLHRRDRPSQGEKENPVGGMVVDCVRLGDFTSVTLAVNDDPRYRISFSVPSHVARRQRLAVGEPLRVSLLAAGIHLMEAEPATMEEARGG